MASKQQYRKAVFIATYKLENDKPFYLLLKRKLHWTGWEFAKGGIESGESLLHAVKRELYEETGLRAIKFKKFRQKGEYKYHKMLKDRKGYIGQTWKLFSAEVSSEEKQKPKIDKKEHSAYKWLSFSQAIKKLTYQDQKKCLRIVDKSLQE